MPEMSFHGASAVILYGYLIYLTHGYKMSKLKVVYVPSIHFASRQIALVFLICYLNGNFANYWVSIKDCDGNISNN